MELRKDEHRDFVHRMMSAKNLMYYLSAPYRLNTVYWAVNSMLILEDQRAAEAQGEAVAYVLRSKNTDGGFGGSEGYPSNITSTFNALQILYMCKYRYEGEDTVKYICGLQQGSGCFHNDEYGEEDTRINCCAVLSLHLLCLLGEGCFGTEMLAAPMDGSYLTSIGIDVPRIIEYTLRCFNKDGGFGAIPGAESHAAQVFCCLSVLRSLGALECIDRTRVRRFITMRQTASGGLAGRINKKEDVCYSFWAYSSAVMIGEQQCIDEECLIRFILSCQGKAGGFSDRPGNETDLYHLMFALAGLSLLGYSGLRKIDAGFGL
ncbi:putative prenyltransferase and squaleneoxidase family protein [Ordospora pajunii]|uniref:putative prenyltransferase and squaleneoxidase family protein n=1 Tax=Ordospora pajunii TaxID=3039483 RepID=UPI0029525FAA|nr:putative prenyltransferase and squaleneoxidase family protein [Ordospora pajunii]KAH9410920.1 putative prenyltransferase and squaleneoxidase family protein [Ordospora pajunii]